LGHSSDHGVIEPAGRGEGIDGLKKGYQVGVVFSEDIGKFQKFLCISGQPGELCKNQAGDPADP
jgi:hypothetical protein